MRNRADVFLLFFSFLFTLLLSCDRSYAPKPRGYFRIALPAKEYHTVDSILPYRFDYPNYAKITPDPASPDEKNWINIEYPSFKGSLHISYKKVNGNLNNYLEDAHSLVMKHISKASSIHDSVIINPEKSVYGMIYYIRGAGVASPVQFYLTDSTHHFLRGAFYFNLRPNNDSMAPVIHFVEQDITQFIRSFNWK